MVDLSNAQAGCMCAAIIGRDILHGPLELDGATLYLKGVPIVHLGRRRNSLDQHVNAVQIAPAGSKPIMDPGLVDAGDVVVWRQYIVKTGENRLRAVTVKRVRVMQNGYARMSFGLLAGSAEFTPNGNDLFLFAWRPPVAR